MDDHTESIMVLIIGVIVVLFNKYLAQATSLYIKATSKADVGIRFGRIMFITVGFLAILSGIMSY